MKHYFVLIANHFNYNNKKNILKLFKKYKILNF